MTDFETHPIGTADLVKRLQQRADEDRAIQKNNEAVASALRGQRLLFDQGIRSDANTFAVRLGLDYENCAKKDAKLSQDWSDAADRIEQLVATVEQLEAALTRASAATAAAYEVAAREVECGCGAGPCQDTANCAAKDAAAIRAFATPDQTAALDKLIAEAVKPYVEALENIAQEASVPIHTWQNGINFKRMYEGWRKIATERIDTARAILAASKKGGV